MPRSFSGYSSVRVASVEPTLGCIIFCKSTCLLSEGDRSRLRVHQLESQKARSLKIPSSADSLGAQEASRLTTPFPHQPRVQKEKKKKNQHAFLS